MKCNAIVYSEYSGDTIFDEQDRCIMDSVLAEITRDTNAQCYGLSTCAKKGTEARLDMKAVNKSWEALEKKQLTYNKVRSEIVHKVAMGTAHSYDDWLEFEKKNEEDIKRVSAVNPNLCKGEKKLIKVILEDRNGLKCCYDVPKEQEGMVGNLKVGDTVYGVNMGGVSLKKVIKIVGGVPEPMRTLPIYPFGFNFAKRAGKNTYGYLESMKKFTEAREREAQDREELKDYQEKPYFLCRLDSIKGKPDGKENLDKIKFPCWVIYTRVGVPPVRRIGMLVTGYPNMAAGLEYQLIDMMEQVSVENCSTVWRSHNLAQLMLENNIEVIKGLTQLWKVGIISNVR